MRLVNSILNGEEMLFNNNGDSSVGSGTAEMWTSIINPDMSAQCIHETIRDRFVFFLVMWHVWRCFVSSLSVTLISVGPSVR